MHIEYVAVSLIWLRLRLWLLLLVLCCVVVECECEKNIISKYQQHNTSTEHWMLKCISFSSLDFHITTDENMIEKLNAWIIFLNMMLFTDSGFSFLLRINWIWVWVLVSAIRVFRVALLICIRNRMSFWIARKQKIILNDSPYALCTEHQAIHLKPFCKYICKYHHHTICTLRHCTQLFSSIWINFALFFLFLFLFCFPSHSELIQCVFCRKRCVE